MTSLNQSAMSTLREIRDSIDNIDAAIVHMLAERFRSTQRIGLLKAEHNMPPADLAREAQQAVRLREMASAAKLDPDFVDKFLAFVVKEVIHQHEAVPRS
jgi:chorismate mutase